MQSGDYLVYQENFYGIEIQSGICLQRNTSGKLHHDRFPSVLSTADQKYFSEKVHWHH